MPKQSPEQPPKDDEPAKEFAPKESAPKESTERGGPKGREPTRYGDWEKNGRCSDF